MQKNCTNSYHIFNSIIEWYSYFWHIVILNRNICYWKWQNINLKMKCVMKSHLSQMKMYILTIVCQFSFSNSNFFQVIQGLCVKKNFSKKNFQLVWNQTKNKRKGKFQTFMFSWNQFKHAFFSFRYLHGGMFISFCE